jgi:hypothetical protein
MTTEKEIFCDENHCFCDTYDEHGDNVCILDSIAKQTTAADCSIYPKEVTPEQKAILDKILIELRKEDKLYQSPHVTDIFPQVDMTDEEWQDDYSFWCD